MNIFKNSQDLKKITINLKKVFIVFTIQLYNMTKLPHLNKYFEYMYVICIKIFTEIIYKITTKKIYIANQFNIIIFLKFFETKINDFELKHCVFMDFL